MYSRIKEILRDVNLLIVEDDGELREVLKSSMQGYVKQIYVCSNAKDALACFKENHINLIVSDINMPRMNGITMAKKIREEDESVPIIFLTAYDSDENMIGAIDVASSGVLKKPFDKRDLVMTMSFAVNKFRSDFAVIDLKNGFIFNSFTKELKKDGETVNLTKKEQNLLHLLLKNQTRTVTFDMIETCVWCDESCSADTIRSFVYKLRKKLYPELIENCQGSGYRLNLSSGNLRTLNQVKYV